MEEKDNTMQAREAAQGADARDEEGAAAPAPLGKFRSVDALMNAYNSLEAEFTRRSQRLRELEAGARKNGADASGENVQPAEAPARSATENGAVTEETRRAVIADYLAAVASGVPPVMAGGSGRVSAPANRARTIEEAGALAAHLMQDRG